MATNIQIRSVPVALRDKLRARARKQGKSMSDYLIELIRRDLEMPTPDEFYDRLRRRKPVVLKEPAWKTIREVREERDRELMARFPSNRRAGKKRKR